MQSIRTEQETIKRVIHGQQLQPITSDEIRSAIAYGGHKNIR